MIPSSQAVKNLPEIKTPRRGNPSRHNKPPREISFVKPFPSVTGQIVRLTMTSAKPRLRVGVFDHRAPL